MDGLHQHSDFRSIGLQGKLCRKISSGNLPHLVFHRNHGAHNMNPGHHYVQYSDNTHHDKRGNHRHPDIIRPALQIPDLLQGSAVQRIQKLFLTNCIAVNA